MAVKFFKGGGEKHPGHPWYGGPHARQQQRWFQETDRRQTNKQTDKQTDGQRQCVKPRLLRRGRKSF